jgi:hypothetical protein
MIWQRTQLETALVIGVVGLCVVLSFDNGAGWHDTAEFASVGRLLTTSHSPGHPLYTALSIGWSTLLPVGTVAFRAACFSGFCCVMSLLLLLQCLTVIGVDRRRGLYWLAGGILSPAVMIQSVRPEVYGLSLLLTSCVVLLWLKWWSTRDGRFSLLLAFIVGLGGANHSYLALIPLPLVLLSFVYRRLTFRLFLQSGLAGMVGLLTYVLLPLRAQSGEFGWGAPNSIADFWRMVSAQEWTKSLVPEGLTPVDQLIETCVAFIEWLGVTGFCIWFLALGISFTRALLVRNSVALILFGGAFSFLVFRGLIEVDIHNPDLMGYLTPGFMIALLAQSSTFSGLSERMVKVARLVGLMFFGSMLLMMQSPSGHLTADRYARQLLRETPIDGVLLTSNYSSWFWTWYLRGIEGQRPDVAVLFRGRLGESWHAQRLSIGFPAVAEDVRRYPHAFASEHVSWEPGVRLPETIGNIKLQPQGLTFAVSPPVSAARQTAIYEGVFRDPNSQNRRQEAFMRYESLRLMKQLRSSPAYLNVHREKLDLLGGNDPLIKALLIKTQPAQILPEN